MNGEDQRQNEYRHGYWTIPNLLCALRWLGSIAMLLIAQQGHRNAFVAVYIALAASDWLDGKLAIWLAQRSRIGPRLDTLADVSLYTALLLGSILLDAERLFAEYVWITLPLASYAVAVVASWIKFRVWPAYHTRLAKISWMLIAISAVAELWAEWIVPLRVTCVVLAVTNVESLLLTICLTKPVSDLASLWHGLRGKR